MAVPDWVKKEQERIAEERKKILEGKGYKDAVKIESGVTDLELNVSSEPRTFVDKTSGKVKYVFDLVKPAGKSWIVPGIVYEKVLKVLAAKGSGKIRVTRIGAGQKDTRYAVE